MRVGVAALHDAPVQDSTTAPAPPGLSEQAAALGAPLDDSQLHQLARLVSMLLETNRQMNLTAVRDPDEAWSRHVLDSLSLAPELAALPQGAAVVDVGAGGGFPGLVLAISRPDLRFVLVDATGKKVRYLARAAEALGLRHVRAVQGRAEELASGGKQAGEHRERYAMAVCRALAPMPVLLELVSPFVQPGGRVLAIKGERAEAELRASTEALERLHLRLEGTRRTPTGTIVTLTKTGPTPGRYPRRSGEPKRAPIGG